MIKYSLAINHNRYSRIKCRMCNLINVDKKRMDFTAQ